MSNRYIALIYAVAILLIPAPLRAHISPPVKMRLAGDSRPALPGLAFSGTLIVIPALEMDISEFQLIGEGWSAISHNAPNIIHLKAMDTLLVDFQGTPGNSSQILHVNFNVRAWIGSMLGPIEFVSRGLDLSLSSYEKTRYPSTLISIPLDSFPGMDTTRALPPDPPAWEDSTRVDSMGNLQDDEDITEGLAHYTVRVFGRIAYLPPGRSDEFGVHGVYLDLWDSDDLYDDYLGTIRTDDRGYFDVWINSTDKNGPDIYLEFETETGIVEVEQANTWEINYTFRSGIFADTKGPELDMGKLIPGDVRDGTPLHILSTISNAWAFVYFHDLGRIPKVDVQWPDDGNTVYSRFWDEIHLHADSSADISNNDGWYEGVMLHEYGHHVMHEVGGHKITDCPHYCNGFCDGGTCGGCNHCVWCPENESDAWWEGWPDWFSDYLTRVDFPSSSRPVNSSYASSFGSTENTVACGDCNNPSNNGLIGEPRKTEGFVAAVLRDIEDPIDVNEKGFDRTSDRLFDGPEKIFAIVDLYEPRTIYEFLDYYRRIPGLNCQDLWETAWINGFGIDADCPSPVSYVTSTSHSTTQPSADPTIDFYWFKAYDNCSGIEGYYISISEGAPAIPDISSTLIGDVTTYTSPMLAPGTYYFNLRPKDRGGRSCASSSASYGPITIVTPIIIDLSAIQLPGWESPLVPRSTADATVSNCSLTTTLPGETDTTYWNVSGRNFGTGPLYGGFMTSVFVDGIQNGSFMYLPYPDTIISPGEDFTILNVGMSNPVRGGRHTLNVKLESTDSLAEPNEINNFWGRQWIWTPLMLSPGDSVIRPVPPQQYGGWEYINEGSVSDNCDGFRINSSGWWNAIAIRTMSNYDDYDCRLHYPSSGAKDTNGFFYDYYVDLGYSPRPAGYLDAVLLNRHAVGEQDWDVGVLNFNSVLFPITNQADSDFAISQVISEQIDYGSKVNMAMGKNDWIILRELYIDSSEIGPVSITVDASPVNGPIHALWLDKNFTTGDLLDYDEQATTDNSGHARLDLLISDSGYNCVVLFRDPIEWSDTTLVLADSINLTLKVQKTPPDFLPVQVVGWHSPLVPRQRADGTPSSVPLPDSLTGYSDSTYFNFAAKNQSPTAGSNIAGKFYLDGVNSGQVQWDTISGNSNGLLNSALEDIIPGGRHTVSFRLDADNLIEEINESNNVYGEQYVWLPYVLPISNPMIWEIPPSPIGGWRDNYSYELLWFNCNGFRTPTFINNGQDGWWGGIASMPIDSTTDLDIKLHEIIEGTKNGFATGLKYSGWSPGQSDFIIVNFHQTPFRAFDIGTLRSGNGTGDYTIETKGSTYRGDISKDTTLGPFTIGSNSLLDLHDIHLHKDTHYEFRLLNLGDSVDWGMTLHPADLPYLSKSSTLIGGVSWLNGPAEAETLNVDIYDSGFYCLSVWKANSTDLALVGTYDLQIGAQKLCVAKPGDANGDLKVNLADIIFKGNYIFKGGAKPNPLCRGDYNADGKVNLQDIIYAVNYVFKGGSAPIKSGVCCL